MKQRGETPAQFYWRMVKAAYTARLGGEEHLVCYHWERPMSELEALDRQDEERQGEVDEGGPIEEQVNEREVQVTSEEEESMFRQTSFRKMRAWANSSSPRKSLTSTKFMKPPCTRAI